MRILCLSNFYPPVGHGGYEEWCHEITLGLQKQGHQVVVLTSQHGQNEIAQPEPDWINRTLHLEMELASLRNAGHFFISRKNRERKNLVEMHRLIKEFAPDVMLVWGMWNLSRALPAAAEKIMPGRVIYYLGDYWPTLPSQHEYYWRVPSRNWLTHLPKSLLGFFARRILAQEEQPTLEFSHVLFCSSFLRDELSQMGISPQDSEVIYGAIDTSPYTFHKRLIANSEDKPLSLLYVGRLVRDKGVHTAIDAVSHLIHQHGIKAVSLSIVGSGDPEYEAYLHNLVQQKRVGEYVSFLGSQPKETLSFFYEQADIFLFTSIWPEPFGRVLIEAMSSGVIVVGTNVGGAAEILEDNQNGLIFSPDDPISLASQVIRLIGSSSLQERLSNNGHKTAVEKFDLRRMTREIELYLQHVVR